MATIVEELKQRKPFPSKAQEAAVTLLRTAEIVNRHLDSVIAHSGITGQQYNVLRILRGAGAEGLPTLEIASRMIEQAPGITRLLDRLETKKLVERRRHSEADFQVRHLVSRVSGKFDNFSGTISVDRANPTASSVEFNIKSASINTGVENRDKDLRGANFFEVEKFPEITFKSTSIKASGKKDVYDVTGTFTMHGVTKTVTLPVEFLGFIKDPLGGERAGFPTPITPNRKDYGINWNKMLDNGGTLLSDDVDITVNIEAAKSKKDIQGEVKKEKS